ncbi:Uncharacterised protein [Bordetella pertussis]|nr:Uncharacterised protein [Bordetella pertussis]
MAAAVVAPIKAAADTWLLPASQWGAQNRHAAGQRLRTLQRESAHGPPYQPGSQQRRRHQQHQRRQQHAETKPETGQNQGHEARHAGKEASDISIKCARPAPEPSARPVLSRCAGGLSPQGDWHPSTARADSRCLSRRGQAPGRCRDGKRPPRCARCAGLLPPKGAFLPWGGPAAKKKGASEDAPNPPCNYTCWRRPHAGRAPPDHAALTACPPCSNCTSSVEPVRAVVEDWPPSMVWVTASK